MEVDGGQAAEVAVEAQRHEEPGVLRGVVLRPPGHVVDYPRGVDVAAAGRNLQKKTNTFILL